jgi:hypothetical protein
MQKELQMAKNEVARMNQEIHSNHVVRSTVEHLGQSSESEYAYTDDVSEQTITQLQNKFNAAARTGFGWSNDARSFYNNASQQGQNGFGGMQNGGYNQGPFRPTMTHVQSGYRGRNSFLNEPTHFPVDQGYRATVNNPPSRPGSALEHQGYNQFMAPLMFPPPPYQPTPIGTVGPMGTRLSPEASEFSVGGGIGLGPTPWNSQVCNENGLCLYRPLTSRSPRPSLVLALSTCRRWSR